MALKLRRVVFASLVAGSAAVAIWAMLNALAFHPADPLAWLLVACFSVTLPWVLIGFWNAVIGFAVTKLARDPVAHVCPPASDGAGDAPLRGPTAVLMVVHEEVPERVFRHLSATLRSLERTGQSSLFELFVLSDTRSPVVAADEERRFALLRTEAAEPAKLHYRRREHNIDHKSGNLWEWLHRDVKAADGRDFGCFVLLDADSLMSGDLLVRMRRIMDANPRSGILQALTAGLPARSGFTRLFQFGMRHGLRAYTTGGAWWQGPSGPYWGHNAIIRTDAFKRHCRLPRLPGRPPLGGLVLSHDQVEAALMRGAGYDVHVLPTEHGSYEENPPTLPDFLKRDLRWCQGNMQYFALLAMPGLKPMGRVQLGLAILMYLSAVAWLGFILAGVGRGVVFALGLQPAGIVAWSDAAASFGIALFAAMMTASFVPKIMGVLDVLTSRAKRRRYGGARRVAGSALAETLFSIVLSPIMAVAQTVFMAGLLFGKTVRWEAQARSDRRVGWGEAARGLWPQTLFGVGLGATLYLTVPAALPWASPLLLGLCLAVPFAVLSAHPAFGGALIRLGIGATPEELAPPDPLPDAGYRARTGAGRRAHLLHQGEVEAGRPVLAGE